MKVLVAINHPGQVHLFKNFISLMQLRNNEIKIVHFEKEVSKKLLDFYNLEHYIVGKNRGKFWINFIFYVLTIFSTIIFASRFKPDIAVGRVIPSLAIASAIRDIPYIALEDTENASLNHKLSLPFIEKIIVPSHFLKDFGDKQIKVDSPHELSYLHPRYIGNSLVSELNPKFHDKSYFIIRFVSGSAYHDIKYNYLSMKSKLKLVLYLSNYGEVFILSESKLPRVFEKYSLRIQPEHMHSILRNADLYIGEGATMAAESAILGTPSIYVGDFLHGNLKDLKENYGLVHICDNYKDIIKLVKIILKVPSEKYNEMANKIYKDKTDLTAYLIKLISNYKIGISDATK